MLAQVDEELRRRLLGVVRLEHAATPNRWLLEQVVRQLNVASRERDREIPRWPKPTATSGRSD